ncbi:Uncharacterised protein [BD1-7 clade bacterium]|uniref:Uncharacterized protein n=1 Tax=BD1-7 clade bacterium TaxID=2029982 RepID=A0A5S9Q7X6_9GAMM|nr:Uncharacterised protein [BD1-7 clade bacterium]CAA0114101.1 Uncharacterised protein [BD1-7 clade bacterium]
MVCVNRFASLQINRDTDNDGALSVGITALSASTWVGSSIHSLRMCQSEAYSTGNISAAVRKHTAPENVKNTLALAIHSGSAGVE